MRYNDTSARGRAQFLGSLGDGRPPATRADDGIPADIARLTEADEVVALAEHDMDEAQRSLFYARAAGRIPIPVAA